VSEKSKKIAELQARIDPGWAPPAEVEDASLLEVGLLCVLARHLTAAQAEKTLRALRAGFSDWNELRVTQVQEFRGRVQTKSVELQTAVARDVKEYLQEVFQKRHGFDLEGLREDPEAGKAALQLEFLGASGAHYMLWRAFGGGLPISPGIVRLFDRLGLMKRTSSMRKAAAELEALVPPESRMDFALRFGRVIQEWCDAKKPTCWECVLVIACPHGKKVEREWKVQQKRLEAHRKRDAERRAREEERERKRAEADARKRAREMERRQAQEAKKRKREEAKRELEAKKRAAAEKRAAEKTVKAAAAKKASKAKSKPPAKPKTKSKTKKRGASRSASATAPKKASTRARSGAQRKKTAKKSTTKKATTRRRR
jgi:endonuclease III